MNKGTQKKQNDGHAVPPSFANPLGEPAAGDAAVMASDGAKMHELEQTLDEIEVAVDHIRTEILVHDDRALELNSSSVVGPSQDAPPQPQAKVALFNVDKWNEEYKVRIDALRHSVDELNAKLDAFKRIKI